MRSSDEGGHVETDPDLSHSVHSVTSAVPFRADTLIRGEQDRGERIKSHLLHGESTDGILLEFPSWRVEI